MTLRLPAGAGRTITPRICWDNPANGGAVEVALLGDERLLHRWRAAEFGASGCVQLAPAAVPSSASQLSLQLRSEVPIMVDSLVFSKKR